MSKTADKLQEAHFFLKKLEEHYGGHPKSDYYLSAYISSSRSLIWIMQSEYCNVKDWREWYNSKEPTLEERSFLKNINELRVRSEKKEPIQMKGELSVSIKKENLTREFEEVLETMVGKEVKLRISRAKEDVQKAHQPQMSNRSMTFLAKINDYMQVVKEFPEQDILPICKKYYSILKALVDECEERFQPINSAVGHLP